MTLKEEEVFDAQPTQDEKVAEWENITSASGSNTLLIVRASARRACVVLNPYDNVRLWIYDLC